MNNQQMMELTTVEKSAFEELVKECTRSGSIDSSLYVEYDVKRGLRDSNGNGVLTGLTEISDVIGTRSEHGLYLGAILSQFCNSCRPTVTKFLKDLYLDKYGFLA